MCGPFKAEEGEGGSIYLPSRLLAGSSQWATAGGWTCCLLLLLVTAPVCTLPNTWGPAPCTAPAPGFSSKMHLPATPMQWVVQNKTSVAIKIHTFPDGHRWIQLGERVGGRLLGLCLCYFHVGSHVEENIGSTSSRLTHSGQNLERLDGFPIMRRLASCPRPGAFGSFFDNESGPGSAPRGPDWR